MLIFIGRGRVFWSGSISLQSNCPKALTPTLGPDATGVGQVFWYTLESDDDEPARPSHAFRIGLCVINSIPCPASPRLRPSAVMFSNTRSTSTRINCAASNIPISTVVEAVQRSNNNVGGNVVEQGGQWAVVRGIGLIGSVEDVENIVIGSSNGTPIYVKNVAEVKLGNAFRTGALDKNGKEAVGGVVIARYGVNTLEVIDAVKAKDRGIAGRDCRRVFASFRFTTAHSLSIVRPIRSNVRLSRN